MDIKVWFKRIIPLFLTRLLRKVPNTPPPNVISQVMPTAECTVTATEMCYNGSWHEHVWCYNETNLANLQLEQKNGL